MRNVKIVLGLAVLVLVVTLGWQVGKCEVANIELQDDRRDMA